MNNAERFDQAVTESILLSIEEGVTIYDLDFRLVAWNEKYVELGITPPEFIQKGLHIKDTYRYAAALGVFGPGEPDEIAKSRIAQVFAGESPAVEDIVGSSGIVVEIRRYFLPGVGVAAVFSDVTAERRLAAKARRNEELELLAQATGGICHDFNNILQVVIANLNLASAQTNLNFIQDAMDAAFSGADLAKSMLQLAHPKRFKNATTFDAIKALKRTITWVSRVLHEDITLNFENCVQHAEILAVEGIFSAAITNLIINAADSIDGYGTIDIQTSIVSDMLRIEIKDDGCGMSQDTLGKVEQPYVTTKGENGTGLGLYEVRRFAETSGGWFSLDSSFGVGTKATIFVPTGAAASAEKEVAAGLRDVSIRANILLVEDAPNLTFPLQAFLQKRGCTVVSTISAESAIAIIDASVDSFFDIIVSDIDLFGGSTGIDLARSLNDRTPSIPIILCTANPVSDFREECPDALILQKPFPVGELCNEILKLCTADTPHRRR